MNYISVNVNKCDITLGCSGSAHILIIGNNGSGKSLQIRNVEEQLREYLDLSVVNISGTAIPEDIKVIRESIEVRLKIYRDNKTYNIKNNNKVHQEKMTVLLFDNIDSTINSFDEITKQSLLSDLNYIVKLGAATGYHLIASAKLPMVLGEIADDMLCLKID